jgi:hypothetical protein
MWGGHSCPSPLFLVVALCLPPPDTVERAFRPALVPHRIWASAPEVTLPPNTLSS